MNLHQLPRSESRIKPDTGQVLVLEIEKERCYTEAKAQMQMMMQGSKD